MNNISRRKFLNISASAFVFSILPLQGKSIQKESVWKGVSLGAESSMKLFHQDQSYSNSIIKECLNEINRLEKIFSIYDKKSIISKLNKKGKIINPPKELVEVINFANNISKQSNGAFDISVQPLWNIHKHYSSKEKVLVKKIQKIKKLINWKNIVINENEIFFKQKGMAITLNGIAQGYITDKITHLLKSKGFTNVLVNLGEIKTIGNHPQNRDWNISTPYLNNKQYISLNNNAIASSGAYGTKFNKNSHHLFNTKSGKSANYLNSVSVVASSAMLADAISTTIAVMPKEEGKEFMKIYPNVRVYTS